MSADPHRLSSRSIACAVALVLAAAALPACTKDEVARNVYEGARGYNNSLKSTPLENPRLESLSYDEYERQRGGEPAGHGDANIAPCASSQDAAEASSCPHP